MAFFGSEVLKKTNFLKLELIGVCGIHNEWVTAYSFRVELGKFSGDRLLMD